MVCEVYYVYAVYIYIYTHIYSFIYLFAVCGSQNVRSLRRLSRAGAVHGGAHHFGVLGFEPEPQLRGHGMAMPNLGAPGTQYMRILVYEYSLVWSIPRTSK